MALDARGFIAVNERLETSAPNVWAIGEAAGSPQFTHVSFDDFRIIRDNLAGGVRILGLTMFGPAASEVVASMAEGSAVCCRAFRQAPRDVTLL